MHNATLDLDGNAVTVPSLTLGGATLDLGFSSSGAIPLTVSTTAPVSMSGTNTIYVTPEDSTVAVGTYYLISASGGFSGTGSFQFANGSTTETILAGFNSYLLTLADSGTAETLTVAASSARLRLLPPTATR